MGRGRTVRRVLTVALLALTPALGSAQTLSGLLLDEGTDGPIDLGRVVLVTLDGDSVATALTDENGFFTVRSRQAGRFFLVATALGYVTTRSERIDLDRDDVRVTQLRLAPAPIPVPGLVVDGESFGEVPVPELVANGFYERWRAGRGEFLTPSQIANHPATYTPQLFRGMESVELVPNRERGAGPWNDVINIRRNEGATLEDRLCTPHLWIDDVLIELMPGESLDAAIPKREIEAIEVYRAPFGPRLRYLRDFDPATSCGAILIWTNRR